MKIARLLAQAREPHLFSTIYGYFLGNLGMILIPFWIGAVARAGGVTTGEIGFITTVQLVGGAAASLYVSFDRVVGTRKLLLVGAVLMIVASLYTIVILAQQPGGYVVHLGLGRFISGAGEGLVLAGISAVIARARNSHKLFSWSFSTIPAAGFVLFLTIPPLIEHAESIGLSGAIPLFAAIVLLAALSLPLFFRLQRGAVQESAEASLHKTLCPSDFVPLIGLAVLFMGFLSLHTFIEPLATLGGLTTTEVGYIKALGAVVTVLGPIAAGIVGTRFGYIKPLICGVVLLAASNIVLSTAHLLWREGVFFALYSLSLLTHEMTSLFVVVYVMGLIAALDKSGRLSSAVPAFQKLGASLGPVASGGVIASLGYGALGGLSTSLYLLFFMLMIGATVFRARRQAGQPAVD